MMAEIKNSHFLLHYIKALLTLEIHIISVKRNKTQENELHKHSLWWASML